MFKVKLLKIKFDVARKKRIFDMWCPSKIGCLGLTDCRLIKVTGKGECARSIFFQFHDYSLQHMIFFFFSLLSIITLRVQLLAKCRFFVFGHEKLWWLCFYTLCDDCNDNGNDKMERLGWWFISSGCRLCFWSLEVVLKWCKWWWQNDKMTKWW